MSLYKIFTLSAVYVFMLSACQSGLFAGSNSGSMTYVDENNATSSVLILESAKVADTGFLFLNAHRYVYGPEYEAIVTKDYGSSPSHPTYSIDKNSAKATGINRWEGLSKGIYTVEVQIGKGVPQTYNVPLGSTSIDILQLLVQSAKDMVSVRLTCPDCASSLPQELSGAYKNGYVSASTTLLYNPNSKRDKELADKKALAEFERSQKVIDAQRKKEDARIAREGDGGADDVACKKYGLKPGTQAYASCRIQIDAIRQQSQQQAQQDQQRYEEEKRRYEDLKLAQEKERSRQQGLKLLEMSARMLSGQSAGSGSSASSALTMPAPPQDINRTIRMPDGSFMRCNTVGNNTTCF